MNITLRRANESDAPEISALIQRTVRVSNVDDYPSETLKIIVDSFAKDKVLEHMKARSVFVACMEGTIVGTASLGTTNLHQMFVDPDLQGHGIGASLVEFVEQEAAASKLDKLFVNASKTARKFYEKVGYTEIEYQGQWDIPTYKMEKSLVGAH